MPDVLVEQLLARCHSPRPRVWVVGAQPGVALALTARGAEVVEWEAHDLASAAPERMRPPPPHAVLLGPGLPELPEREEHLRAWVEAAHGADVFLHVWNEGSARELLGVLLGHSRLGGTLGDACARRWLRGWGLTLEERLALRCEREPLAFPEDTARHLSALLHQLSPDSAADQFLYVARRGPSAADASTPEAAPPTLGLLSLVLWAGEEGASAALDRTLFSLACQNQAPFELLLVTRACTPAAVASLHELLERHRRLADFEVRLVAGEESAGRLLNRAIASARGQYLSLLTPEALVYPDHYRRLVDALGDGRSAWALARVRLVFADPTASTPYLRAKYPLPIGEQLDWSYLWAARSARVAFLVDRTRLGSFDFRLAEHSASLEEDPLLLRLAALFPPVFTGGLGSFELMGRGAEEERAAARGAFLQTSGGQAPSLQNLSVLLSGCSLRQQLELVAARAGSVRGMHHVALERVNDLFKQHLPSMHEALKNVMHAFASH